MGLITFSYDVPLDQTLAFESVYHEELQLDCLEKQEIRDTPDSLFAWLFLDGVLAGESYGVPLAVRMRKLRDSWS